MNRHRLTKPIFKLISAPGLWLGLWLIWALWQQFLLPQVQPYRLNVAVDLLLAKPVVWGALPCILFLRRWKTGEKPVRDLFAKPFPVTACVILLCLTAAFLHTVRLVQGLGSTYAGLDWIAVLISLSAGVVEEFGFRGCIFTHQESWLGFWPAAVLNGAMFTLFHYPELLLGGSFAQLISWRGLLIFVMGIVFCWMFRKWRNLALNMVVHTVWDILSFLFCLA